MSDPRLRLVAGTELASRATEVLETLDRVRVVIRAGGPAAATAALVSLATRLFSHVEIDGDAELGLPSMPTTLVALMDRLSWLRPTPTTAAALDRILAVGPADGRVDIGAGGGAWTVRVGCRAQPLDEPGPGLGLRVAAGLAVAELAKEALEPLGWVTHRVSSKFVWNLLNYQLAAAPADTPTQLAATPPIAIAGVGSVGTSLVAALADDVGPPFGDVMLIDPECFDSRNPFRYPALIDDVTGSGKAAWARQHLAAASINAQNDQCDVASWVRSQPRPGFHGILVASPDNLAGRTQITDVLAHDTITIGVAGMAFHVARHRLGDGLACPYCQCVPLGAATTQAGVYAAQTGLPVGRILQLLQPDHTLSEADVAIVCTSGHLPAHHGDELIGHRLDDLIARVYAEIEIPTPTNSQERPVALAAPQVSLIAGAIAAAELRKAQLGLPLLDRRIDIDLTGLPQGMLRRPACDSSGRCLCASPFRQRWMRELYQVP